MTLDTYKPVRLKYADWAIEYSAVTDTLIKRKRIFLFTGATSEEWMKLANDFLEDGGRANFAFCMTEYKKLVKNEKQEWLDLLATPKPDLPELPDEIFDWQEENP